MRPIQWLLLSSLGILMSGCAHQATLPRLTEAPPSALWDWQLQARAALTQGEVRQTANLDWQQQGAQYQLTLFGPFGQGATRLEGAPFWVTLTLSEGEEHHAATPEQLLARYLDWPLPLSNLAYWVQGFPAPGPYRQPSTDAIEQDGWLIQWARFSEQSGWWVPHWIRLEHQTQDTPLNLILSIHTWVLPAKDSTK